MLLKVVFDKTAIVIKFMISIYFKQNIDEMHSKQPKIDRKIHTSLCHLKISKKKFTGNLYGFLIVMISITGA